MKLRLSKVFSVGNTNDRSHKLVTVCGAKIKFKRKDNLQHIKDKFDMPKFDNPLVTILIPCYNQYQYTINCLWSIKNTIKDIPYEVIIADDCSSDKTRYISKRIGNIRVIKTEHNSGFLLNCNNALKHAKGVYVWFLNNDTIVKENALTSLIDIFKSDEKAGAVGSKLLYENGRLQSAGSIVYQTARARSYGCNDDPDKYEYNYQKEVDYSCGASLLVRRDILDMLGGGFDTNFVPGYYEDTDLCFSIHKLGYKVIYQPLSEVIHYESISHKDAKFGMSAKNKKKFYEKWKDILVSHSFNESDNFFARDRSQNKKVILFCYDWILRPDTNCGNRSSFQYIKFLVSLGYNVKYAGKGFSGGLKPYEDLLTSANIEIIPYNNIDNWLKKYGAYIDYVFINRPEVWEVFYPLCKIYCPNMQKLIYQGHDIHYLRLKRGVNFGDKNKYSQREIIEMKNLEQKIWGIADTVLYFSKQEIDIVKSYNPNIQAYQVPLYLYDSLSDKIKYNAEDRQGFVFVGGYGHIPNIDAVVWFMDNIFPQVCAAYPDIKFYIAGSNPTEKIKKYAGRNVIVTGYISDDELDVLYSTVRMAVVPLRYGAGVKGKIIEAIQNKVPVITTDIGAEGVNNTSGIIQIANTEKEFANAVINLYKDCQKLNDISALSHMFIEENFSKKEAEKIIKNILNKEPSLLTK